MTHPGFWIRKRWTIKPIFAVVLLLAASAVFGGGAKAQEPGFPSAEPRQAGTESGPTSCAVYFVVVERDQMTVSLSLEGLNKPQRRWYEKHGNRGKFAGICYRKVSDAPPDAPLYAIVWGEHLASQPYTWTSTSTEQASGTVTLTDEYGGPAGTGRVTMDVPVRRTHSGVESYYLADGWLAVWDSNAAGPGGKGKGNFIPIGALHNHNRTDWTSASTSLLKDALNQIRERENGKKGGRPPKKGERK
jgi:hypothetical protein